MVIVILFMTLIATTGANHGVPWHIKLGYQNIDVGTDASGKRSEGIVLSYENLFNRQVHSYFSSFTEISYSSYGGTVSEEMKLYHYGLGIKWNFGPTDFDYEPAGDYEFALNQGSLYLKMGVGYTDSERASVLQNVGSTTLKEKDFSVQYGLGYELLGKRTGFFMEYMNSESALIAKGILRAGVNWRF